MGKGSGKSQLNLSELASNYMKYMENIEASSPLTLRAYRLDLGQAFGGIWETEKKRQRALISTDQLLAAARSAQMAWGKLSPASRNRKFSTLKSFFGYLLKEGHIDRDLSVLIHTPKVPKRIPHYLSVDEVMAALKSFDQEDPPVPEQKLLFLLLYGGGLRVSEACSLQWKDVDLSVHVLRVQGKGGKTRLVALPHSVIKVLKPLKKRSQKKYIWGDQELNTRTAYEWVRSRGIKAGLVRPIHPHALRHSFATHLLTSGANLRTLQELLGHESLQATEKYTHLGVDQLARTLEKHHPFSRQNNLLRDSPREGQSQKKTVSKRHIK
jgi:integrase/recombinase XerC/integrase/recombinase XerD